MKKLVLSLFLIFIASAIFAFPNKTVKKEGEAYFIIKDNVVKFSVESYGTFKISDNELLGLENDRTGKIEKEKNFYIFSFYDGDYLSRKITFDNATNNVVINEIYKNGKLDNIKEYDKNSGNIIKAQYYSDSGMEEIIYEYSSKTNKLVKMSDKYPSGTLYVSEYDEVTGNRIHYVSYFSDGSLFFDRVYTYYDGTDIEKSCVSKSESGDFIVYEYSKESECIKESSYDKNRILTKTIIYTYDNEGYKIKSEVFDGFNKPVSTTIFKYEGEHLISEISRDVNGKILYKNELFYDYENKVSIEKCYGKYSKLLREYYYDINTDITLKYIYYDDKEYYRVIYEYNREDDSKVDKEIYEIADGEVDFYYTYEIKKEEHLTRRNKYSADGKLLEWEIYELWEDSLYVTKSVSKYKDGRLVEVKDYSREEDLLSRTLYDIETNKVTKYKAINFSDNNYELSSRKYLSDKITGYYMLEEYEEKSKVEYLEWNDNYKAIVRKYTFGFSDEGYTLLEGLKTKRLLIGKNSVYLCDYYSDEIYGFRVDENGFIDYESCYQIKLIKK